jgi:hypothetical protein
MNKLISKSIIVLITILHILVVMFVILIPFSNSNYLLLLHSTIVPFIIFHWIVNNNTCILTNIEHYLREKITGQKVDSNDTFMGRLINPIYDFKKNNETQKYFIYSATIFLLLITLYKIYKKRINGEIKSLYDMFKI